MMNLSLKHPDTINDSLTLSPRSLNQEESKVDSPQTQFIGNQLNQD